MLNRDELAKEMRQPRNVDLLSEAEKLASNAGSSIQHATDSVVKGVTTAASNITHQADVDLRHFVGASAEEAANAIADAFNGPLAGSRIENGKVVGPIAEVFGSEPVEFAVNAVRFQAQKSADLANRVMRRLQHAGKIKGTTISIKNPATGKVASVALNVSSASKSESIALAIAAEMTLSTTIVLDEAHRILANLPEGRGIDGVLMPRGFFGIDDAIFWPCAIALFVGLLPFLLPPLIAIVGNVVSNTTAVIGGKEDVGTGVSNVIAGKPGNTSAANSKPAAGSTGTLFGFDMQTVAIAGAGVLLILILVFRKKHHAGPPPAPVPPG